jgi:hypothetical protein
MSQSGPVVISRWCEEDLRFMLQPPERLGMDDPIPIMLKGRPERALFFKALPPLGHCTKGRKRGEDKPLPLFQSLSDVFTHFDLPIASPLSLESKGNSEAYAIDKFTSDRLCF